MELRTFVNTATEIKYYSKTKTVVLCISEIQEDGTFGISIEIKIAKDVAREMINRFGYRVTIIHK